MHRCHGGVVLGVFGMIYVAGLVLYLWKIFLAVVILLLVRAIYIRWRKPQNRP